MDKLVSVIIPVYNHARRLKQSLFSISKQTYKNLEVIIVNDGSTDNFNEVFEQIKKTPELSGLKIVLLEQKNAGAPAARNRGFFESKGEYVLFWDADTIGNPDMVEKMVTKLSDSPGASYVYSQFIFGFKKFKSKPFNANELKKVNYIDTTSLLRREAVEPFDESLKKFQDWDLWLNLLSKNKIGIFIPEVLYKKTVGGRRGISEWLPSFVYHLPWKLPAVKRYEEAKKKVLSKYFLI